MINSLHLLHYLPLHFRTLPLLLRTPVSLIKLSYKPQLLPKESRCRIHQRISGFPLPSHFPPHKLHWQLALHLHHSFANPLHQPAHLLHTSLFQGFDSAITIALKEAALSQKV